MGYSNKNTAFQIPCTGTPVHTKPPRVQGTTLLRPSILATYRDISRTVPLLNYILGAFLLKEQVTTTKKESSVGPPLFFFSIPFIIFALLFSFPPSRNSDPGSQRRIFSTIPTTVRALHFYRGKTSAVSSLADSRRFGWGMLYQATKLLSHTTQ